MTGQRVCAVIGANFGDEGKGLAVDYFSSLSESCLVVRHNGGAQAGHTVELGNKRFVFHQLSSGSFRHADTLLAETFFPDLFKLTDEAADFRALAGFVPVIYADTGAGITIIDDVLLNMALETSRGRERHGSCGMGIYEAVLRTQAGIGITIGRLTGMTADGLFYELARIRREYGLPRLAELGLKDTGEFGELLVSENVLRNFAEGVLRGAELITPASGLGELASKNESIIFEGAQGLLLDQDNKRYAPHLTASYTGLHNPMMLCRKAGLELDEAVYVMRSYVTRHGAGPLPCECQPVEIGELHADRTNIDNRWQGSLRFGVYPSPDELADAVLADLGEWRGRASLFVTHLNETNGEVRFSCGNIPVSVLSSEQPFRGRIETLYTSYSPFGEHTVRLMI